MSFPRTLRTLNLILLCFRAFASISCGSGYSHAPCIFVPAKPGQTPPCATPGSTSCENVAGYPTNLIKTLLKNSSIRQFITDETRSNYTNAKRSYNVDQDSGVRQGNFRQPQNGEHLGFQQPPGYHRSKPRGINFGNFFHRLSRHVNYDDDEDDSLTASNEFLGFIHVSKHSRNKRQISSNREQLCDTRTNYINPQAALNSRGNWMFIVNGVETATQLVRTETCASTQCSNLCQLPNNYSSRCEQKYVQKRLIALDSRGEKLYNDVFWFPSCCVCTLSNSL